MIPTVVAMPFSSSSSSSTMMTSCSNSSNHHCQGTFMNKRKRCASFDSSSSTNSTSSNSSTSSTSSSTWSSRNSFDSDSSTNNNNKRVRLTACCTNNTTATATKKKGKTVQFNLSVNHVYPAASCSTCVLDETLRSNCWFTPCELHAIRLREAKLIQEYHAYEYGELYKEQMMKLLSIAASKAATKVAGNSNSNSRKRSNTTTTATEDDIASLTNYVSACPVRGLENQIISCIRIRRKEVVSLFFKSQTALQTWRGGQNNNECFTKEFQYHALAQHYAKLSCPAKHVAQLLAQGDAIAATQDEHEGVDEDEITLHNNDRSNNTNDQRDDEVEEDFATFQW